MSDYEVPANRRETMDGNAPGGSALTKTTTAASQSDGGGLVRQSSSAALLLDSLSREVSSASSMHRGVSNVKRETLDEGIPFGAVIHFTNHSVAPMLLKPWKVGDPQASTGTGFYIGDKIIITNSHVIHHNTSLRLERHGQPGNFAGRVLCESVLCDLAMVTVDDETFWEGLPSVTLQDEVPRLDDTVVAVGYPLGAKSVTVTRGVVSNVALSDLSLANTNPPQLCVQIDAAINPGNSGGPVFNVESCSVVGVAFSGIDEAEGHGFIIPVPVMRYFLDGFKARNDPLFGLLPELGIATDDLVNPVMRKSCFGGVLPKHRNGCLITGVARHSCAEGQLRTGDILMAVDGAIVSEKADVEYRGQERLSWKYLVSKKQPGEAVEITVLRAATVGDVKLDPTPEKADGGAGVAIPLSSSGGGAEELKVTIELAPVPRLLPRVHELDYHSTYCIYGGLVVIPAGMPLQRASIRARRYEIYDAIGTITATTEFTDLTQQSCILADVLAHRINVSYDNFKGEVIKAVNGTAVKNMRHLVELLSALDAGETTIDFDCGKSQSRAHCVFDTAEAKECEAEILGLNKVPCWCSPGLLQ